MEADRKRRHSGSPKSPPSSPPPQLDWNAIVQRCILAAKDVSESRNHSFSKAKESITELFECMKDIEKYGNASPIKYLLSQDISTRLCGAITGSILLRDNQFICTFRISNIFSEVAHLALKWYFQHQSGSKTSETILALGKAVEEYNKHLSWPNKVTTNFVLFPKRAVSQQAEWYGSLEFAEPEAPNSNTVVQLPLHAYRLIRHATSTVNAVKILQTLNEKGILTISGKNNPTGAFCPLVWCGVKLTDTEISQIPDYPKNYVLENRYGGVIFEFRIKDRRIYRSAYVFGTRRYLHEYSQAILIPDDWSPKQMYAFKEKEDMNNAEDVSKLYELEQIPDLLKYNWKASYNTNGDWTHPELVFTGDLRVDVYELKIYFSGHSCTSLKKPDCADCNKNIKDEVSTKLNFDNLIKTDAPDIFEKLQWNPPDNANSGYYRIKM